MILIPNSNNLIFGDSFQHFESDFHISSSQVSMTYYSPTKSQTLPNGVSLYYKSLSTNKLGNLLIATQEVNNEIIFGFGYWIPSEILQNNIPLINILEIFVNKFGLKILIGDKESYFFSGTKTMIYGKLETPLQIVTILGNENIPCDLMLSFKENLVRSLNWVDINYCFAINNNKYNTWLNSIETESIQIHQKWDPFLKEIVDLLDPYGSTRLKILKSVETKLKIEIPNDPLVNLIFPKPYKQQFKYIEKLLLNLKPLEKIVIIPEFNKIKCIFCGSGNISSEHILPRWIRPLFNETQFESSLHINSTAETLLDSYKSRVVRHSESSHGYTTNHVCITCNTGWMSKLEDATKSILVNDENKLIDEVGLLFQNKETRTELSKWLLVKSLLLAMKSNIPLDLPNQIFLDIKNGFIPDGFIFEVIYEKKYNLDFVIRKGLLDERQLQLKKFNAKVAKQLSYKLLCIVIHFGNFIFRVSYFDPNAGLKRITHIKTTKILYPINFKLDHLTINEEAKKWDEIESKLRIHILSGGFLLTEK